MKRPSTSTPSPGTVALTVLFILCAVVSASAQTIIKYNWEDRERTACPAEINRSQSGEVVIEEINDILFKYKLNIVETRRTIDDWQHLSALIGRAPRVAGITGGSEEGGPPLRCTNALKKAQDLLKSIQDIIQTDPALPIGYKDSEEKTSIKLSQSLAAWAKIEELRARLRVEVLELQSCDFPEVKAFTDSYEVINEQLNRLERIARGPHQIRRALTVRSNTDYTIKVEESFEGEKISDAEFECKPESGQLTLTVGALFSRIPDRGYEKRKVPGMTDEALVVEGNSKFRPEGVALLNYLLPYLDNETFGLALSAGPVIRFGSKSDLSTLGFFTGVSGHLYRRFYVTPGIHFGEFADFPVGFHEGQAVAADFGALSPVKRWTGRFALAISFRTASFGNLVSSGETGGEGKKDEKVRKKEGDDRINSASPRDLTASTRGTAEEQVDQPSLARTAALRSLETRSGSQVTIAADSTLGNYTSFITDNVLYILLPQTKGVLRSGVLNGRGFKAAKLEQNGNNLIVSFIVPRGVTARVTQKFNRLEVSFDAPADVLASASR